MSFDTDALEEFKRLANEEAEEVRSLWDNVLRPMFPDLGDAPSIPFPDEEK